MATKSLGKYESDNETIHGILLEPSRLAKAGTPPSGEIDSPIKVKISKSNKEFGLRPRGVRLSQTLGTAPNTFKKYAFLPVLTVTAFNSSTFALGATIEIDSVNWTVVAKVPEDY